MLKAFLNAFRVPDLRNKILFTLFMIAVYRFGTHVPVPVVDVGVISRAIEQSGTERVPVDHQPVLGRRA